MKDIIFFVLKFFFNKFDFKYSKINFLFSDVLHIKRAIHIITLLIFVNCIELMTLLHLLPNKIKIRMIRRNLRFRTKFTNVHIIRVFFSILQLLILTSCYHTLYLGIQILLIQLFILLYKI